MKRLKNLSSCGKAMSFFVVRVLPYFETRRTER